MVDVLAVKESLRVGLEQAVIPLPVLESDETDSRYGTRVEVGTHEAERPCNVFPERSLRGPREAERLTVWWSKLGRDEECILLFLSDAGPREEDRVGPTRSGAGPRETERVVPARPAAGPRDAERVAPTRGSAGRPGERSGEQLIGVVSAYSCIPTDGTWGSGEYTGVGLGSRGRPM